MISILRYICLVGLCLGISQNSLSQNKRKKSKRAISQEVAPFSFESDKDRRTFESHFFNAQKHKLDEEWEEEIKELNACLEVTNQISATYYELAKAYAATRNVESSIDSYKKALALEKDNIWYTINLANAYRSKFDYESEYTLRKKLTEQFPESDQYRQSFIESLLLLSKHDEAVEQYNILERNYGIQPEYSYKKHQLFIAKKDWKSAEKEILKLIEEFPTEYNFQFALAEYYIYIKEEEKAKETYENVLKQSPNNGSAEYGLFQMYFQKEDLKNAEKYLKSALESGDLTPAEQLTIIKYAYAQYTNNLRTAEEISELLDISIALHPDQFEYYAFKGDLIPITKYEEKVSYYKKAVQLNPQFQLYNVIYEVYFTSNAYDSTIAWTQKTIEQFEYRPEPYLIQAYSHYSLNQFKESVEMAENGLEFIIDNQRGKIPFLSIIGTAYNSLKQYEKSDESYEKILKIEPEDVQTLNNYSYYLAVRKEKLDKAEKMIQIVLNKEPKSSTYIDTYGWIKYQQGDYKKALELLLQAIDLTEKPSAEMFEHVGDCYIKLNNTSKAIDYWKKALEVASPEDSKKLEEKIKSNE